MEAAVHQIRMRFSRARAASKRRHDGFAKVVERYLVAEEKSLVGGHCLDHLSAQWSWRFIFQPVDQFVERGHAVAARDRKKPAFGQVLLLDRKHQT